MKTVSAAIVGLGWWGRKMAELILEQDGALRIGAIVEPGLAGAEPFSIEHGIPLYATMGAVLADEAIDAVILATPHELHAAQIEAAAAAGKHIFCEKPLALTREAAVRAVRLCETSGIVLGMGHERRFEPPIADMLRAAAAGELGRLLQIEANFSHDKFLGLDSANWRLDPKHAPAGGMTATGIHLTDLAVKLMGPAASVSATCENLVSELPSGDTMSAHVRFVRGGTAYISATLATPFISRFAVYGSKGWIEVRDRAHVEAPDGWVVIKGVPGRPIETVTAAKAEPVLDNIEAFARAILGEAPYPISGREMIDNIAILEAITQSIASGEPQMVKGGNT
jgi:predicted dehydrogenase